MSEPAWTPGPWQARQRSDGAWLVVATDEYETSVTVTYATTRQRPRDNATLIASAPDLYDALDQLIAELPDPAFLTDGILSVPLRESVEVARAALARARGEQP